MKQHLHEITMLGWLLTTAFIVHVFLRHELFSFAPAPLLLATLGAWLLPRRWHWPILLSVATELFTTLPGGVATAIIVVPFLVWWWRGSVEVGLSFAFLGLLVLTSAAQFLILAAVAVINLPLPPGSTLLDALPWQPLALGSTISSLVAFIVIQLLHNRTLQPLPVVALSHIRYGKSLGR